MKNRITRENFQENLLHLIVIDELKIKNINLIKSINDTILITDLGDNLYFRIILIVF